MIKAQDFDFLKSIAEQCFCDMLLLVTSAWGRLSREWDVFENEQGDFTTLGSRLSEECGRHFGGIIIIKLQNFEINNELANNGSVFQKMLAYL